MAAALSSVDEHAVPDDRDPLFLRGTADNVTTLTILRHLRANGAATNVTARDLAPDLGDGACTRRAWRRT
eukprot:16079996-Heterocapsa_arctica.AAC.1